MSLVEVLAERDADAPLVLTCEHASEAMPDGWRWHAEDLHLRGTHWAFDPGAADLTRELAAATGAGAVLASFTRLLVDPNRPLDSDTLIRLEAEGRPVALNRHVDEGERGRRLSFWQAYHDAADRLFASSRAPLALSVHTFTPVYEGQRRRVEVGVLFDREERLAEALRARLDAAGFDARLNEPYSGKEGLIHSVSSHASDHGRRALELELRQDLAVVPRVRARVVEVVKGFARDHARG